MYYFSDKYLPLIERNNITEKSTIIAAIGIIVLNVLAATLQ